MLSSWADLCSWTETAPQLRGPLAIAILTIAVAVLAALMFHGSDEHPLEFTVAPPRVPEKLEILEKPSIKSPKSSAIQCYAPATGQFLGLVNPSTPAGIDRAIEQAHAAQMKWEHTTFAQRRQVLRTLLAYILKHQDEICRVACLDSGKPMIDASIGEVLVSVEKLKWTIDHGERALRPSQRPTNLLMLYKSNSVTYEPLGVVAALVSWNYPFHNFIGPVISAIFAGNGIVVKASENTAWSSSYFASIVKGALLACGHDPGLVQTVVCWPQTANHLTCHPGISHITFIGSRPVAHKVVSSAATALIPCVVELGGKDASILLGSAKGDLGRITEILLRGTFQSAGQNCVGIERIIACSTVYDELVQTLEPRIRALRVGSVLDSSREDEIDVGAMISDACFDKLEALIQAAVQDGARLLVGGARLIHPVHTKGHYFQPTLLVDVTPEMAIAQEESFAPVCMLMRARNAEHAVEIANSADYGLGSSVFGREGPELSMVVRKLRVGMVAVNDFGTYYSVQLPFGGVGGSGYGRFAGEEGLRGLCNAKSICEDKYYYLGARTALPPPMRYPIPDTTKGYEFSKAIVGIGYGMTIAQKLQGIVGVIRNGS